MTRTDNLTIKNLPTIAQAILLSCPKNTFQPVVDFLIKKIVCLNSECQDSSNCSEHENFKISTYYDLQYYQLNANNLLKKQTITEIINDLSVTSIVSHHPKICVIEAIEYSTLEASNAFLKFLENIPPNTYLIFLTNQINQVLPTIKSRCQTLSLSDQDIATFQESTNNDAPKSDKISNYVTVLNQLQFDITNFSNIEIATIINLLQQFINNDNAQQPNLSFLLIKDLVNLKEKAILFFDMLYTLIETKFLINNQISAKNDALMQSLFELWNNDNQQFLAKTLEVIASLKRQFNNKINLTLLYNAFFIEIYQG